MDRRQFIGNIAVAVAAYGDIRALLLHLSENMWCDWPTARMGENLEEAIARK